MEDWKELLKKGVRHPKELQRLFPEISLEVHDVVDRYPMYINPYFLNLIKKPGDPIWKQVIPSIDELTAGHCISDPLNEEGLSAVPNLVHKYPDRVLFLVTNRCATYCRFCTRKRMVGTNRMCITEKTIDAGLRYLRNTPNVREVLLSGGDPLILEDHILDNLLARLKKIRSIEVIRIGSRIPCTLPMRINEDLISVLKKYPPIYINTHFNHPTEITSQAETAASLLADNGIVLGCQTVLLKGINDNAEILKKLFTSLLRLRIKPYYLFQGDLTCGTDHFRTTTTTGIDIMRKLYGHISGLALPTYALDAPGGQGKIPLTPQYILGHNQDKSNLQFENYLGNLCNYPEIIDEY